MFPTQIICSIFILPSLLSTTSAAAVKRAPQPFTDFTDNIFFYPASDAVQWRTLYARSLQLPDESLLMTWENYPKEPPLVNHPIYKSIDGGATWSNFSQIEDQVNGWGMRFQPFLYTLPQDFGTLAAGTILAAGVSAPYSLTGGVYIDLYASTDEAKTWNFVSHIAYGDGPETITNGNKALWEPFLLLYKGQIICFYSDQTDPAHGQRLVHRTTTDLLTWSDPTPDVEYSTYTERPGMTTVAHIESTDKYIMTFEFCGSQNCAVHYKVASSPLEFNAATAIQIKSNDSSQTAVYGSPYVIWTLDPTKDDGSGLIIASGNSQEPVFINGDGAEEDGWKLVDVGMWSAYSRSLRIITLNGAKKLLFGNGGNMGNPASNSVACGVIPVPS